MELDITIYNFSNSSSLTSDYRSSLEYLLNKESIKYDIYFFENEYSHNYYTHLMELKNYISEDYFSLYSNNEVASKTCIYNGKWFSFVKHFFY